MKDFEIEVLFEVIEVAVAVQQPVAFLYAESGDNRVDRIADRYA